jgi:hypothetical protein
MTPFQSVVPKIITIEQHTETRTPAQSLGLACVMTQMKVCLI